jgi:hypothetical protein
MLTVVSQIHLDTFRQLYKMVGVMLAYVSEVPELAEKRGEPVL